MVVVAALNLAQLKLNLFQTHLDAFEGELAAISGNLSDLVETLFTDWFVFVRSYLNTVIHIKY